MDVTGWLAVAAALVVTVTTTLHLALIELSHSAIQRVLSARGKGDHVKWLVDHRATATLMTNLCATLASVAFVGLVMYGFVAITPQGVIDVARFLTGAGIAAGSLWIIHVLASAIARHMGPGITAAFMLPLRLLVFLGQPIHRLTSIVDEIVRRLSGAEPESDELVEAELLRHIEDSQLQGDLDANAAELIENVVEFRSTDVGEVMTPRTDVRGIEFTDDLAVIRQIITEVGYSRIPVYEENLDHIVGILYVKDLVPYLGEEASGFQLRPLLRQPIIVPPTKLLTELLSDFQRAEVHMAVVIDEYGGTTGLATIEDVLEELVGEIQDEHDPDDEEQPALRSLDYNRAEVDGRFHIDDLNEEMPLGLPEDEEFDTIGGFVLSQLGRVPKVGETVEWNNARFTTVDATPTHVRRIEIELLQPVRTNGEAK